MFLIFLFCAVCCVLFWFVCSFIDLSDFYRERERRRGIGRVELWGGSGGGERGETTIRLYCMKKNKMFKGELSQQKSLL